MNLVKMAEAAKEASESLKLISHPTRLQVLCFLADKKKSVQELEELVQVSQSLLSQHLAKLKAAGILQAEREGKYIYYSIADKRFLKIIIELKNIFCP